MRRWTQLHHINAAGVGFAALTVVLLSSLLGILPPTEIVVHGPPVT
jgi:hypothetical protein